MAHLVHFQVPSFVPDDDDDDDDAATDDEDLMSVRSTDTTGFLCRTSLGSNDTALVGLSRIGRMFMAAGCTVGTGTDGDEVTMRQSPQRLL